MAGVLDFSGATTRSRVTRALFVAVLYLAAWTLLDVAAVQFQAARDVSVWYPPPALDLALLLVFGLRWTPLLLVNTVVHTTVVNPVGLGLLQVAILDVVTTGAYAGAALALLRGLRIDPRLAGPRDVGWLVVVSAAAAMVVSLTQVLTLSVAGEVAWGDLALSVAGYWAGSTTGIVMLAPVLLLAARAWTGRRTRGWPQGWTGRDRLPGNLASLRVSRPELVAQFVVLLVAVYAAFASGPGISLNYTYLVFAPLIWIAVRGGLFIAAPAVLVTNVGAVALNGGRVPGQGGIALQFGLVTVTVTGVLLGALITQRRLDTERHRHDALHDALTGLPNRVLFTDRLTQAIERHRRDPERALAVMFLDLDNFKQVNDSLGHHAGDLLLTEVARRLRTVVRSADSAARLGGDEFALIAENMSSPDDLGDIAARVLTTLGAPHQLDHVENPVVVNASIGSVHHQPAEADLADAASLLRSADVALHQAKRAGRNQHVGFTTTMRQRSVTGLHREGALRRALDAGQIEVAFQPVVALSSVGEGRDPTAGRRIGAEALARWTLPDGPVPPSEFIPLAEETGLILAVGEQVLRQACSVAVGWTDDAQLAVNVSGPELSDPGYTERVLGILDAAGLPRERLELEITETRVVTSCSIARQTLTDLADAGVGLIIDDFGTEYSSFSYLRELPVHGLKIDRSFVDGLPGDHRNSAIVRAILTMAHELGLAVIAEGVETPEQLDFLREHRCPLAQGYLLGRPV